ncbi:MAG: hypothetical protein ABSD72_06150 [Terracidiphilus sp.]|jgi:hypothetical protein
MRSYLVFKAVAHVLNRYQLCQLVNKATRRMHRPNTRIPDTTNEVLRSVGDFMLGSVYAVKPPGEQKIERRLAA